MASSSAGAAAPAQPMPDFRTEACKRYADDVVKTVQHFVPNDAMVIVAQVSGEAPGDVGQRSAQRAASVQRPLQRTSGAGAGARIASQVAVAFRGLDKPGAAIVADELDEHVRRSRCVAPQSSRVGAATRPAAAS